MFEQYFNSSCSFRFPLIYIERFIYVFISPIHHFSTEFYIVKRLRSCSVDENFLLIRQLGSSGILTY